MMRLSLLRTVVDSIDGGRDCTMADEVLARWGLDAGPVRYIRASANVVFGFTGGDGVRRILRLTPAARRGRAAVEAELGFVRRLAAAGVSVAEPVPTASGMDVHTVSTPAGVFHATVFLALSGVQKEIGDLTLDEIGRWGSALGRLHVASRGDPGHDRPSWRDQLPTLPTDERTAVDLLERVTDRLADLPAGEDDVGLIHGDFELDNVMWENGHLSAMDFDDCGPHWFVADIAMALRDLREPDTGRLNPDNPAVRAFLDGYRGERALPEAAVATIPLLLALYDLTEFGLLLRIRDLPAGEPVPDWLRRLDDTLRGMERDHRDRFAGREAADDS